MPHNLHEFALATQAGEYLVGLLGLLLFIPFWRLLMKPPRRSA
jgi:hypothetical protein